MVGHCISCFTWLNLFVLDSRKDPLGFIGTRPRVRVVVAYFLMNVKVLKELIGAKKEVRNATTLLQVNVVKIR